MWIYSDWEETILVSWQAEDSPWQTWHAQAAQSVACQDERDEPSAETLLKGRSVLRCPCGAELFVQEHQTDDGRTVGQFVPCPCGNDAPVIVPPGSMLFGVEGARLLGVWAPPHRGTLWTLQKGSKLAKADGRDIEGVGLHSSEA